MDILQAIQKIICPVCPEPQVTQVVRSVKLHNKRMELLDNVFKEYGVKEVQGKDHNERIVKYFTECGFEVDDDETAWCSAFVNWVCKRTGLPMSNSLLARSWLNVGEKTYMPKLGDLAVFERGTEAWMGHVGFYVNENDTHIYVLGGNQSNQVHIAVYPKSRLISFQNIAGE